MQQHKPSEHESRSSPGVIRGLLVPKTPEGPLRPRAPVGLSNDLLIKYLLLDGWIATPSSPLPHARLLTQQLDCFCLKRQHDWTLHEPYTEICFFYYYYFYFFWSMYLLLSCKTLKPFNKIWRKKKPGTKGIHLRVVDPCILFCPRFFASFFSPFSPFLWKMHIECFSEFHFF